MTGKKENNRRNEDKDRSVHISVYMRNQEITGEHNPSCRRDAKSNWENKKVVQKSIKDCETTRAKVYDPKWNNAKCIRALQVAMNFDC